MSSFAAFINNEIEIPDTKHFSIEHKMEILTYDFEGCIRRMCMHPANACGQVS